MNIFNLYVDVDARSMTPSRKPGVHTSERTIVPRTVIFHQLPPITHHIFLVCLSFSLFCVFVSGHHSDQMSEGSQVSKVTICVQIIKWHSMTKVMPWQLKKCKNESIHSNEENLSPFQKICRYRQRVRFCCG